MKLREQVAAGALLPTQHAWLLEMARRINKDNLDLMVDDSTKGVILKSPNGHYWRLTVSNAGSLTTTDLGTNKP